MGLLLFVLLLLCAYLISESSQRTSSHSHSRPRLSREPLSPFTISDPLIQIESSETEPECFFADVYFNAQPIGPQTGPKDKQRAPNALVPSKIAYFGSSVDFAVNMGSEVLTCALKCTANSFRPQVCNPIIGC